MSISYNIHQRVAIGVTTGLFALTTFVVYMRLYIRCVLMKAGAVGYDDLTVFIAWIMALGASIATYFEVISGLGRHIEELSPAQVYDFGLSLFIVIQFYNVGLNTVKMSFLCQYHRLFPDPRIRRVCFCFCFGLFCFFWMFVQAVLYAFSCVPITGLLPGMKVVCVPTLPTWTAISCLNVFTDLLIFCIPVKPLWGMQLLKRQRYLLIAIFCVGFLICIISIIRIPTLRRGAASPDPSFTNVTTALWSLAELDTAILCTSLPVLRPLVARFVRGVAPTHPHPHPPAAPGPDDDRFEGVVLGPKRLLPGAAAKPDLVEDDDDDPSHGGHSNHRRRRHRLMLMGGGRRRKSGHSKPLPGESLLYDTGLSGSTLRSGNRSFLRSLLGSRAGDGDAELQEDHHHHRHTRGRHRQRAEGPAAAMATVEVVDGPKGSYGSRPLDAPPPPPGLYKDPQEKLLPRPPLAFYPRAYPSSKRLPPVPPAVSDMVPSPAPPLLRNREFSRQEQQPSPVPMRVIPDSPLRDTRTTRTTTTFRNNPLYYAPTSSNEKPLRRPVSASASDYDDDARLPAMTPYPSAGGICVPYSRLSPLPPRLLSPDGITTSTSQANDDGQQRPQRHQQQQQQQQQPPPPPRPGSSSSQICSRCASTLASQQWPQPPPRGTRWEEEDKESSRRSRGSWRTEEEEEEEVEAERGKKRRRSHGHGRSVMWAATTRITQTHTHTHTHTHTQTQTQTEDDDQEGEDEKAVQVHHSSGQQAAPGPSRQGQRMVNFVAVAADGEETGADEPLRSWRGPPRQVNRVVVGEHKTADHGPSSRVEEILPRRVRLRLGDEEDVADDDVDTTSVPRWSEESEKRKAGTSWLRLSMN